MPTVLNNARVADNYSVQATLECKDSVSGYFYVNNAAVYARILEDKTATWSVELFCVPGTYPIGRKFHGLSFRNAVPNFPAQVTAVAESEFEGGTIQTPSPLAAQTILQSGQVMADVSVATPIGSLMAFAGAAAPQGWLLCDGSEVSRQNFAGLFAVIGSQFGDGDTLNTFNVPDLRARIPVGAGPAVGNDPEGNALPNRAVAAKGGVVKHVLGVSEIPSHNHNLADENNNGIFIAHNAGGNALPANGRNLVDASGYNGGPLGTTMQGGGNAHENMPPYLALNYIIRAL